MSVWLRNVAVYTAIGVLSGMLYASGILDVLFFFSRHSYRHHDLFDWHSTAEYVARWRVFPLWFGVGGAIVGGVAGFLPKRLKLIGADAPAEADATTLSTDEEKLRGWRVRYVDSGIWAYEEQNEGSWMSITFRESGDALDVPKVIIVPSAAAWTSFPPWAAPRRNEILGRIRSELKEPQYAFLEA